jgi:electron transfer flavoprotein alpha subunit
MAQNIAVVAEQREGKLNAATLETITAAQRMGEALGLAVEAVILEPPSSSVARQLASLKLARILRGAHEGFARYTAEQTLQALTQIFSGSMPAWILFPHTYQVRDYAARLAVRMGRALISDCIGYRAEGGRVTLTRLMFQGKLAADVSPVGEPPFLVSFQIGAFRGDQAQAASAPAPIEEVGVTPDVPRVRAEEPFKEARQAVDLTQAQRIVAVGRGIKEPKNLDIARQLAEALGAELAASRPICDSGWLPMDRQIGSSGQTVAPKLYVAVGISGAIQHLVGMKGSRTIVAINKDPEAPIFEVADYGIVGNLFEVVPALTEEVRKLKG